MLWHKTGSSWSAGGRLLATEDSRNCRILTSIKIYEISKQWNSFCRPDLLLVYVWRKRQKYWFLFWNFSCAISTNFQFSTNAVYLHNRVYFKRIIWFPSLIHVDGQILKCFTMPGLCSEAVQGFRQWK